MKKNKKIMSAKLAILATSSILSFYNCTGCVNNNGRSNQNSYDTTMEDRKTLSESDEEKIEMLVEDAASLDVLFSMSVVTNDFRSYLEDKYNRDEIAAKCKDAEIYDVDEYDMDTMEFVYDVFPSSPLEKQIVIYKSFNHRLSQMLNENYYRNVYNNCAELMVNGLNMEYDENKMYEYQNNKLLDSLSELVDLYETDGEAVEVIYDLYFKESEQYNQALCLYDLVNDYKLFEDIAGKSGEEYLNSDDLFDLEDSIFDAQDIYYELCEGIISNYDKNNMDEISAKKLVKVNF